MRSREELAPVFHSMRAKIELSGIPDRMHAGVLNYAVYGSPVGGFLIALFSNDFMETVGRADDTNINLLKEYAEFIFNRVPEECHGSIEKVKIWIDHKGMMRCSS